jgi:hypothetical protein
MNSGEGMAPYAVVHGCLGNLAVEGMMVLEIGLMVCTYARHH